MTRPRKTRPVNDDVGDPGSRKSGGDHQRKSSPPACPICFSPHVPAYKPFCSKRCADVDLNRWLNGGYAIPVIEEDGGVSSEDDTQ